jgi:antagonist of KipI
VRLIIQKSGIGDTIQDEGRQAARVYGVPLSGALDWYSYWLSNILLDNELNAATLEIVAGVGWSAKVLSSGTIACCGPGSLLYINQRAKCSNRPYLVHDGDTIEIKQSGSGVYTYLSTSGGWDVPLVFGSSSTCLMGGFGGFEGRTVQIGDILQSVATKTPARLNPPQQRNMYVPPYSFWTKARQNIIRVIPGPEHGRWSEAQRERFTTEPYLLSSQRDRMGIRLKGYALDDLEMGPMISTGVLPGTIQVPPDGQPIVLLNDAQTIGGYPRIGQICWADLPKIIQCLSGQHIYFQWIGLNEAEMLMYRWRTFFDRLRFNINLCNPF